jgi:hypothetical protein
MGSGLLWPMGDSGEKRQSAIVAVEIAAPNKPARPGESLEGHFQHQAGLQVFAA